MDGKDVLSMVAEAHGMFNWALVHAEKPQELSVASYGKDSIPEMAAYLKEQKDFPVLFGLVRLSFGTGRLKRVKNVFVVSALTDGACSAGAVKTGKLMGNRKAIEDAVREMAFFHTVLELTSVEQLEVEAVLGQLASGLIVDASEDVGGAGAKDFWAAIEEEKAQRKEAEAEAATEAAAAPEDTPVCEEEAHDDEHEDQEIEQEVMQAATSFRTALTKSLSQEFVEEETLAEPEKQEAPPAPEQVPEAKPLEWKGSNSVCLKHNVNAAFETTVDAEGLLLNKTQYNSIPKAVQALNLGDAPLCTESTGFFSSVQGFCVIYSVPKQQHVLLYKDGPPSDPEMYRWKGLVAMMMAVASMDRSAAEERVKVLKAGAPEVPAPFRATIMKQATNIWAEWQCRTFECRAGRMRYWSEWNDVAQYRPRSDYSLLGCKATLERHSQSRFNVNLKAGRGTTEERVPYAFMANTSGFASAYEGQFQKTREQWIQAIKEHTQYATTEVAYKRACFMLLDPGTEKS